MNTLSEDMNQPLPDVQRAWLRRPLVLLLVVVFALFIIPRHICRAIQQTYIDLSDVISDCW